MKQLLTVMAILLFTCLTQAFTVHNSTKASGINDQGIRTNIAKWQHSTWVDPWTAAKKYRRTKTDSTDALIDFTHETGSISTVGQFRLIINGNTVFDKGPTGNEQYTVAEGSTVTLEVQVAEPTGFFTIFIEDESGELFSQDTGYYAIYTFTATAGNHYNVYAHVY